MISRNFILKWKKIFNWQTLDQIEQDLILSRAIVDLYSNEYISNSLIFRGGTALNKLFMKPASRFSEDLDFVQKRKEPISRTLDEIRDVLGVWLGKPKKWGVKSNGAKLFYKYESVSGQNNKIKIEINTTEQFQVLPINIVDYQVESDWFSGSSKVVTYGIEELIATKLRALYQRRKGRDLYDLWYVCKDKLANIDEVISIFLKYCKKDGTNITREDFLSNLELKISDKQFIYDMDLLLSPDGGRFDIQKSYEYVVDNVINKIP